MREPVLKKPTPTPKPSPRVAKPRPPTPRAPQQKLKPAPSAKSPYGSAEPPDMRGGPTAPLPDPSFPVNVSTLGGYEEDFSPSASMLNASAGLERRGEMLQNRDYDQARGDIQADLARQLAQIEQNRTFRQEDTRRKVDEMQRRLPIAQQRTGASYAGRGLASSGAKNEAQAENQRTTDEAVGGAQRDLDRDILESSQQEAQVKEQAARQEREINDQIESDRLKKEADDLQAKIGAAKDAHSAAQARAKAQKAGVEAKRTEATAWMGSRINQLLNAKVPKEQAEATALSEARQFFTGVPDTYLAGAIKPSAEKAPRLPVRATQARYGQPISLERGNTYSKEKKQQIKSGAFYKTKAAPAAKEYMESLGNKRPSAMGFLQYYENTLVRELGWSEEKAKKEISNYAPQMSYILAENGWT